MPFAQPAETVVALALEAYAKKTDVPAMSTTVPLAEAKGGAVGTKHLYPAADHQHPRITSATYATLDGSGLATVTFTRVFANKPSVAFFEEGDNTNPPTSFKVKTWVVVNGEYTGCVVYGVRPRALPVLMQVSGVLTTVTTGVNALVTALTGYSTHEPSSGVTFSAIALASSVPVTPA